MATLPALPDLILHQYDASPFCEKLRLIFGFKSIAWRAVDVPMRLPKPDVVALTGGYRRTPFLQIGADVYCDTALIADLVDRLVPTPPLFPASAGALQHALAQWADSALFWAAVPYAVQAGGPGSMLQGLSPGEAKAFGADRAAMTVGRPRLGRPDNAVHTAAFFGWVDAQLAHGQPFLLGAEACIADFSVAHALWFVQTTGAPATDVLKPFVRLAAWYARVTAFGHGDRQAPLRGAEAIARAAQAAGHAPTAVAPGFGFEPNAAVTIAAADYATDPVDGVLVGLDAHVAVLERQDPRAGTVHVHFPRLGYQVRSRER